MTKPALSESDFIEQFELLGPEGLAKKVNIGVRAVYMRRTKIENRIGRQLVAPQHKPNNYTRVGIAHPHKMMIEATGTIIVFSDAHYWPGLVSTAHKALIKFIKELQPTAIIANGDVFDGASISRHSPIGWENRPSVIQEIEACQERLEEIERVAKNAKLIWSLGNHDGRFETRLATVAPEYAKIHGTHLKDFFPRWKPCWSVWAGSETIIKHRFKGGVHATHNNTLYAGKNIVTSHLHSLKVTPFDDYDGTRYGVDTGTLADPFGPQFEAYTEQNPLNWRSGFAVLTWHKGELLWPQLVKVRGQGVVEFERKVYEV